MVITPARTQRYRILGRERDALYLPLKGGGRQHLPRPCAGANAVGWGSPTSPFQGEVLWSLLRGCLRKGRRYSAGLVAALAASRALSAAAFFSTQRTDQIEASYSNNNGTASESWLSTSGGVRTAAIMNA